MSAEKLGTKYRVIFTQNISVHTKGEGRHNGGGWNINQIDIRLFIFKKFLIVDHFIT